MSLSRRGLLAVWLALQLLLAQQFALAHHLGHLAERLVAQPDLAATTVHDGEEGGSATHLLSHACTTCLASISLGAALADASPATQAIPAAFAPLAGAVSPAPTFQSRLAFHSRAPPRLQD